MSKKKHTLFRYFEIEKWGADLENLVPDLSTTSKIQGPKHFFISQLNMGQSEIIFIELTPPT